MRRRGGSSRRSAGSARKGHLCAPAAVACRSTASATTAASSAPAAAHRFSVTSGTIFASRKLPIRDLLAVAIFVNAAKGHSALQLSRGLDVQYKTPFVMAHKSGEALSAEPVNAQASPHPLPQQHERGVVRPQPARRNPRLCDVTRVIDPVAALSWSSTNRLKWPLFARCFAPYACGRLAY